VWASAELLKHVFAAVPHEQAYDPERFIVVTVPAAFGQAKNTDTRRAAELAGLGSVTLIPEPVAAAIAVFHKDPRDQTLLIFDIGGGTFDASVVRLTNGKPDVVTYDGIEEHGGADWDRLAKIANVYPWLATQGVSLSSQDEVRYSFSLNYVVEKAKIAMSTQIHMNPSFAGTTSVTLFGGQGGPPSASGQPLDINVPISRSVWEEIVNDSIDTTVSRCEGLLRGSNLGPEDIDGVVFVGGPTLWPPLRREICERLGIREYDKPVNPQTVVAEGASIYAQIVKASGLDHSENAKEPSTVTKQWIDFPLQVSTKEFVSDTKCVVKVTLDVVAMSSAEFEIRGAGFASKRMPISLTKDVVVDLYSNGDCVFTLTVFPPDGAMPLSKNFTIARLLGVPSIRSNRRAFVRAMSKDGERYEAIELVARDELIPKEGSFPVKTTKALTWGEDDSVEFKIFEGDIRDPITDNRFVGAIHLSSRDLAGKSLPKGAGLICHYHMDRGLSAYIDITIPDLELRVEGKFLEVADISDPMLSQGETRQLAEQLHQRIREFLQENRMNREVSDLLPKLSAAITALKESKELEVITKAQGDVREIAMAFWRSRFANLPDALSALLQERLKFFKTGYQGRVFEVLKDNEKSRLEKLEVDGSRAASEGDQAAFDVVDDELDALKWRALWRCEWWVKEWLDRYNQQSRPENVRTRAREGLVALDAGNFSLAKEAMSDCIDLVRASESGQQTDSIDALDDDIQLS
jgi:molecular chaperone DnaK